MTHRGPCQPRTFCDAVILCPWGAKHAGSLREGPVSLRLESNGTEGELGRLLLVEMKAASVKPTASQGTALCCAGRLRCWRRG